MATTIVSCIFYYDETVLETWIKSGIPLILFVSAAHYDRVSFMTRTSPKIELRELPDVSELEWYSKDEEKPLTLPFERNERKDTLEHLWKMHLKIHCVYLALKNGKKTPFYAYIDFDAPKMFRSPVVTLASITETFLEPHIFDPSPTKPKIYLPGCWGKISAGADLANKISWRFCGSFFFGGYDAILEFYQNHILYFSDFLASQNHIMTWEVNFWAYLEWKLDDWNPGWYSANHDDTIIKIPGVFGYKILSEDVTEVEKRVYDYPDLSPFRPMSAAYVEYRGKSYINTRYVNYWIYGNGGYYYPEDEGVIRTLNICSELEAEGPIDYVPMTEEAANKNPKTFSEGIEDIRLYVSGKTGELCFIGSTLGYSHKKDKIRMIRGVYDVETLMCRDFQHLDPPRETWCEKNWAPIPLEGGTEDGFIYKWFPLEIGKVSSEGKLDIVVSKEMDERFKNMKGSTTFVPYGTNSLIGVVHFSEEMHPRQYFHRVVVLDRDTYEVVRCSGIFCFVKASVEFCIGFRFYEKEETERIGFWISRMDRDPLYIEIDRKSLF